MLLVACGSTPTCVEGHQNPCICDDGRKGTQTCKDSAYGACVCPETPEEKERAEARKLAEQEAKEAEARLDKLQAEILEFEREARRLEEQLAGATTDEERERLLKQQADLKRRMRQKRTKRLIGSSKEEDDPADPLGGL
jgi:flagellar motility protein MotE (MotC chaperone)